MTIDELNQILSLTGAFGIGGAVVGFVVFALIKSFIPSYLAKKAENLATREDVAAITHEIERVRSEYAVLIEQLKARHQLRMAALDRRLQAHQEAFELWRELLGAAHTDGIGKVVLKCQSWWEKNCLYLEPKVREAFVAAYSSAHTHQALIQGRADSKDVQESWDNIVRFPNTIFEAIQLPPLTEIESKPLALEGESSSRRGQ
ncbi:MAG: hypothetical protein ACOY3V_08655 [Pseudomonadota bacterium]